MLCGWKGNILKVDLSREKTTRQILSKELAQKFLGGRGVNSRILYQEVGPQVAPLGPENVLIVGVGPITGTLAPASGRYTITALSPLTVVGNDKPCFGDSNAGGFFGPEIKFAGLDHMIFYGRAEKPVYLWIDDDQAEIKDASHLWGKDTWTTDKIIREEVGDDNIQIAYIGPAGENLVRIANVMNNLYRAAGRCGIGAVMGSKNLKAIAVKGTGSVKVANPRKLENVVKYIIEALNEDPVARFHMVEGTPAFISRANAQGKMGTKNYQQTQFDGWEEICAETLWDKYWVKSKGCFCCPIHCSHFYEVRDQPYVTSGGGPEYVTLAAFGAKCLNSNLASILYANTLSNKLGLDTQSMGSAIAWAMECWDRGILNSDDTGGVEINWGDHEIIIELIKMTAFRHGFGDILAEGAYRAAKLIGKDSIDYVIHAKGQDPAVSDARALPAFGLGYAVSSRGGDHLRAFPTVAFQREEAERLFGTAGAIEEYTTEGKGRMVKWYEDHRAVIDSLSTCKFIFMSVLTPPLWLAKLFNAVTGLDFTVQQLMKIGERVVNLERAFNLRQGLTRKDDTVSRRWLKDPIPTGPMRGRVLNLEPMLDEYYEARGWDIKTGYPRRDILESLSLEIEADELQKIDKLSTPSSAMSKEIEKIHQGNS